MKPSIYLYRNKLSNLQDWQSEANRKPLVIRGARQVGKTTLVNEFATSYSQYIYLNLEKAEDSNLFEQFRNVNELIDAIFLRENKDVSKIGSTLLFIDEIQESPKAMSMLRLCYITN